MLLKLSLVVVVVDQMRPNVLLYVTPPLTRSKERLLFRGGAEVVVTTVFPVDVEQHELLESEGLHVRMVDHVETEVEQRPVLSRIARKQRTDVQFQLVEHLLIHVTVAVDEVTEELILFNRLQV